jgi:hypothetical protein
MVKPEDAARQSPAIPPLVNGMSTQQQLVPVMQPSGPFMNGVVQPPPPPRQSAMEILEAQKSRPHAIGTLESRWPPSASC